MRTGFVVLVLAVIALGSLGHATMVQLEAYSLATRAAAEPTPAPAPISPSADNPQGVCSCSPQPSPARPARPAVSPAQPDLARLRQDVDRLAEAVSQMRQMPGTGCESGDRARPEVVGDCRRARPDSRACR